MKRIIYLFAAIIFIGTASCKKTTATVYCPKGPIDPGRICPLFYKPVCGCDKVTYDNSCEAEKSGISIYTEGKCP
jgi:Kazal-type serine protease inhibitor domain